MSPWQIKGSIKKQESLLAHPISAPAVKNISCFFKLFYLFWQKPFSICLTKNFRLVFQKVTLYVNPYDEKSLWCIVDLCVILSAKRTKSRSLLSYFDFYI